MKKLISILCVLTLIISCFSIPAFAEESEYKWWGRLQEDEFEWELGDGVLLLKIVGPDAPHAWFRVSGIDINGVLIADSQNLKGDVVIPETIAGYPVLGLYSCFGMGSSNDGIQRHCLGANLELETVTLPKTAKYLAFEEYPFFFGGNIRAFGNGTNTNAEIKRVYGLSQLKEIKYKIDYPSMFRYSPTLNPFEDTYGHWSEDAVNWAFHAELVEGTSHTRFTPEGKVNRGMAATILHRLAGKPKPAGKNPFSDVSNGKYYAKAVRWASENGVVLGYGDGKFRPNTNITREQLASMIYRYAQIEPDKYDMSVSDDLSGFVDEDSVSKFAREAMEWAVGSGVISGRANGKIDPKGTATRAELATMMERFAGNNDVQ